MVFLLYGILTLTPTLAPTLAPIFALALILLATLTLRAFWVGKLGPPTLQDSQLISTVTWSGVAWHRQPSRPREFVPPAVARWGSLAEQHIVKVEEVVRNFNQAVLESLIPENVLRAKIEARNLTFYNTAHDTAIMQLSQIIADERSGILQITNHYFADTLAKTREERVVNWLKGLGLEDGEYQTINLAAITYAAHLGNEYQAVNDIHDILKVYYKVALKWYMDNVVLQVVERIYLGSNGPVRVISPEYVGTLSDTELADIAAKSYATSSTRTEIGYKLERLDKALNLAETLPI